MIFVLKKKKYQRVSWQNLLVMLLLIRVLMSASAMFSVKNLSKQNHSKWYYLYQLSTRLFIKHSTERANYIIKNKYDWGQL